MGDEDGVVARKSGSIASGESSGFWEARKRKDREVAVKAGTLSRSLKKLPSDAPTDEEIDATLGARHTKPHQQVGKEKLQETIRQRQTSIEMASCAQMPHSLHGDIGYGFAQTARNQVHPRARRTNETYDNSEDFPIHLRAPVPASSPSSTGMKLSIRTAGNAGVDTGTKQKTSGDALKDMSGTGGGAVSATYAQLPTDAYRYLAENGRKWGIGEGTRVRVSK
eukprot:m.1341452 g.1341452  ORF g.1341452 m.1341452 type:complete len:223 (+) comp24895_c0_seq6:309-977(+)